MNAILAISLLMAGADPSNIKSDEVIVFFDTWAYQEQKGGEWVVPIHGWVYEPEAGSLKRATLLALLEEALDVDDEEGDTEIFRQRARLFLVDNERGKHVSIRMGGKEYAVGESQPNGHFAGRLRLPDAEVASLLAANPVAERASCWVDFEAVLKKGDDRSFKGRVLFLSPTGVSVISDIDDTVRISGIGDSEAVLRSTFMRELEPVAGMAELYRRWARAGASFHYVSDSPWQLHEVLHEFLSAGGFPPATLTLKAVRLTDSSFRDLFADPRKSKPPAIEAIMRALPGRRFILVGDSGQKDPEIYGRIARKYPEQVLFILIRNVGKDQVDGDRYVEAFKLVPRQKWRVVREPQELADAVFDRIITTRPETGAAPRP